MLASCSSEGGRAVAARRVRRSTELEAFGTSDPDLRLLGSLSRATLRALSRGDVIVLDDHARLRLPIADSAVSPNPTLSFEDYLSSAYRPFEQRTLWVGVSQPGVDDFVWELWTGKPDHGDIVLGKDPRGEHEARIASGRYWVGIQCAERRQFGPMQVVRAARAAVPFRVP
jgi:hypothetical protein